MPILNLAIGKSKYTINCDDGEEEKIFSLAERLNQRVNKMSLAARNADEKTILMLCALIIEEDLESTKNQKSLQCQNNKEDPEEHLAMQIEAMAQYVQNLTQKIKNLNPS
jgi:cell division protein ZapA